MIGDVVGDPGMEVLERRLPAIIKENSADFVVVNGENAAGGFGLTADLFKRIIAAGADLVTSGNHVWEKREFWSALESEERILRPMNYPEGSPGKGWVKLEKPSPWGPVAWLAVNLQGREFMKAIDCPFKAFDSLEATTGVTGAEKPLILVDFHAESSREKEALAYYLDGRASLIAGTHTHIQTADERLLPKGSAYITDLGMTGTIDGIIGMDTKICLDRARNQVLYRMEVAGTSSKGKTAVQGIIAEIDAESRKAVSIKRL
jgi:2',3'-cyclic-nucleotide 2'-phosphodiesterase